MKYVALTLLYRDIQKNPFALRSMTKNCLQYILVILYLSKHIKIDIYHLAVLQDVDNCSYSAYDLLFIYTETQKSIFYSTIYEGKLMVELLQLSYVL